ncbi:MAG: cytochrome c [Chloroflexi bacterium]|nr:cytochrome c [Chloroflexota bacterium]MCC6895442.1 cytochrome c [Anaerolineae bacterium]
MSASSRFLIPGMLVTGLLTVLLVALLTVVRPVNSAQPIALDPAAVKAGKTTFLTVCAGCHGPQALGINGLGKPLVGSAFFNAHTDAQLLAFLQVGRPVDDPLNTTGVVMPARGGRLSLTDTDLSNVIAYIRSLNVAKAQPVAD